jgi:membrane protein
MAAATARPAPPQRLSPKTLWELIRDTLREWSEDKVPRLGAALAYYAVFSLAPLLVIAIAVASLVFDPAEVQRGVVEQVGGLVGSEGASLIETMIQNAQQPGTGIMATILGVVGLLLGALGAFGQLQDALNTIWEVKPKSGGGLLAILRDRLLSLTMVLVVGFLLLVSLVISAGLAAVGNFMASLLPESELLLQALNFVLSFAVITVLFALMFKYMPDAKIAWGDVWIGAAITALLFTIGKLLIGLYLGNASVTSSYGAAGSLAVLLLWMYYSSQIFFLGAEFTQVYANRFGSRVVPAENAERLTAEDRAQQGIPKEGQTAARAGRAEAESPGAALAPATEKALSGGVALPVVGPYVALEQKPGRLARGMETLPIVGSNPVLTALVTFAAGLGTGAVVALQSRQHAREQRLARRAERRSDRKPGRRGRSRT